MTACDVTYRVALSNNGPSSQVTVEYVRNQGSIWYDSDTLFAKRLDGRKKW